MTELEVIDDILKGIEIVRPGEAILAAVDPPAALIVNPGITALYEGLVALRDRLVRETDEERRADLAAKIIEASQNYAAARFGAMPDGGGAGI